ncbi:hypothetical protein ACFWGN_16235 [Oerskovia sp. NPDC060338]|uniref:hypothetical protein n=1 Tax=Oerskovia sp. NPDC060338 TaxID=3347100 RepID=UPI00366246CD
MSDQHVNAEQIRVTLNSTSAIAAHLGIVLDQDGHEVTAPEGATLLEAVAHLLYSRHTRDRFGAWDELTDEARAWWADIATDAALVDAPTVPVIAERLYNLLGRRPLTSPWASFSRGERARWIITAQHVARLIADADPGSFNPGPETVSDPAGNRGVCVSCADSVGYLSSRDRCDGCEALPGCSCDLSAGITAAHALYCLDRRQPAAPAPVSDACSHAATQTHAGITTPLSPAPLTFTTPADFEEHLTAAMEDVGLVSVLIRDAYDRPWITTWDSDGDAFAISYPEESDKGTMPEPSTYHGPTTLPAYPVRIITEEIKPEGPRAHPAPVSDTSLEEAEGHAQFDAVEDPTLMAPDIRREDGYTPTIDEVRTAHRVALRGVVEPDAADAAFARFLAILPAPTAAADEATLGDLWDDGNAVGLDGWVGPGRGEDVDEHAVDRREKAVYDALARLRGEAR